jgi:3'(2'), 5'-bisphosphate nucleotidase
MSEPEHNFINPWLLSVLDIARAAGDAVLDIYQSDDFGERLKSDASPLTEADLASHEIISRGLDNLEPRLPILSEEAAELPWKKRADWGRYWLVDPLDGTKEFIKRNGEFTINIALVDGQRPVLGVVHAPVLGVTWLGSVEDGALRLDADGLRSIQVQPHQPGEPWRVVGSRSHAGDGLGQFLAELGDYELLSMGSSIKLCLVAEGSAHLYPRLGPTSEWDTAAAHAVVLAAGGEVVNAETEECLSYNTKESLLNPFFIVRAASSDSP